MKQIDPVTRLIQASSLSERGFRDRFGFSKQFMVDATAGTYTRLSDRLHEALKELTAEKGVDVREILFTEYRSPTLDEAYTLWQTSERRRNRDKFVSTKPDQQSPELSPAHFFVKRTSGTPTRFSKELKVPPQQVRRWVSGQVSGTPDSIRAALSEIAYPWLRELLAKQEEWTAAHDNREVVSEEPLR